MSDIRLKIVRQSVPVSCGNPPMINEALKGLQLPDIVNTKVMEYVSFGGMAQETFGRFVRDWMLNWGSHLMPQVTKAITMNINETRRLMRHVFFKIYENNGGNKKDLMGRENYYSFTSYEWDKQLGEINLTGIIDKKLDQWKKILLRRLDPGEGNDVDPEIMDKALDDFIEMKKFLQEQGSKFYRISQEGPEKSIDSKGNNFSHMWSKKRKVMKSVRKYLEKRDIPMLFKMIQRIYDETLLANFNVMFRARDVTKLRKYLNKEGKNWVDIDKLLKDPGEFRDSRDAINNFVEKAKYRHAYDTMCSDVGEGEIAPKGKPCIIKNYDDGYFWFSRGGRSCEIFGEEGRNCGAGAYTLIDLQRKIKRGDQTKRSWFIGLDYDIDRGVLHQVLGFGNSFPMEKYWPYIKDFIASYDVEDIDPKVFNYLASNSKVSKEEIFKFIMTVGNDSVKSKWIERTKEDKEETDAIVGDILARTLGEVRNRLQKNLALKFPVEIDEKRALAVHQWYKNKRNKNK